MNSSIAQIVALTCYGNAFLSGRKVASFFPQNSTCNFCDRINFVTIKKSFFKKIKEKEVAATPDNWFVHLKASGAKGICLSQTPQNDPNIPDRMAEAFVGCGGIWAMEALFPRDKSEYWEARWEVSNRNALDKRSWRVTYSRISLAPTFKKE